jgi:hypothetical protein
MQGVWIEVERRLEPGDAALHSPDGHCRQLKRCSRIAPKQ